MADFFKRCWAQIDLSALDHNFRQIRALSGDAMVMAVVKSDAYGHGAREITRRLSALGVDWFAVAELEEALELRSFGITEPILILGCTPPRYAKVLAENNISQNVFSKEYGLALASAAKADGVSVRVHIKIDVGMGRLGFRAKDDPCNEIASVCRSEGILPEGIFMHFPSADFDGDADGSVSQKQFGLFCSIVSRLQELGISFAIRHACNSAGILSKPFARLDLVRAGNILYGLSPSSQLRDSMDYKPVMRFVAEITQLKTILPGDSVSYGMTFEADREMRVATVAAGYADGFFRSLSNRGKVMINGRLAPVIGRVCMDQFMVDVTDLPCKVGDHAVLFGCEGLSCEEYAECAGTINYEAVCLLNRRVTRVYSDGEKSIAVESYMRCNL